MVDAAPWREGSKLMLGLLNGVQRDAVLASGVRLVGRVTRTGPFTSDVAGPGDLGFHVPAIALWLDGERTGETHVLGRLVSKGRNEQGQLLLHWKASLPLEGDTPERSRLYTGSGDPGVPRGLLIGETWLPTGPGPHTLVVEPPTKSRILQDLKLFQFEGPSRFVRRSR
jgi:cell shape-determining protein MreC